MIMIVAMSTWRSSDSIIYVGIGIAKVNPFSSVISSEHEVLAKAFKFSNNSDVFRLLASNQEKFNKGSLVIILN